MKSVIKITFTGFMILLFSFAVFAIAPQLSIFNDGNFDKTLYTNGTSSIYINISKNATIISAVFNATEVDLGVVNYEPIYNFYTLSVRNGTDEAIAAGTRGYIVIINRTNGNISNIISNSQNNYIRGSDFKPDGSEALLVDDTGYVLVYNATSKTITSTFKTPVDYLRDVAYSSNGSFAIIAGDAVNVVNFPIVYYNSSAKTFHNLTTYFSPISMVMGLAISPNDREVMLAGYGIYKYNLTCGIALMETNNWNNCSSQISPKWAMWRDVAYNS